LALQSLLLNDCLWGADAQFTFGTTSSNCLLTENIFEKRIGKVREFAVTHRK
jgi:hypothetical protein